jgi:hypothetical protein
MADRAHCWHGKGHVRAEAVPDPKIQHPRDAVRHLHQSPDDELYDAKVTVPGEQIQHHVKEEEAEMFPKAKKAKVDSAALGARMSERKSELMEPCIDFKINCQYHSVDGKINRTIGENSSLPYEASAGPGPVGYRVGDPGWRAQGNSFAPSPSAQLRLRDAEIAG